MIGDDTVRGVDTIDILCTKFALIWPDTSQFVDFVEYWGKDISIVIRPFVLNGGDQSLETHASVDVF